MSNGGTKKPPATPKPTGGTSILKTLVIEKKPKIPPASTQKPAPTPKPTGGTAKKYSEDK